MKGPKQCNVREVWRETFWRLGKNKGIRETAFQKICHWSRGYLTFQFGATSFLMHFALPIVDPKEWKLAPINLNNEKCEKALQYFDSWLICAWQNPIIQKSTRYVSTAFDRQWSFFIRRRDSLKHKFLPFKTVSTYGFTIGIRLEEWKGWLTTSTS